MFTVRIIAIIVISLAAAGAFAGCADGGGGDAPSEPPPADKVLALRYWQAPSAPLPYLSSGDKDMDAGAIALEPLAGYAPDGSLVPRLAESVPTVENGGVSADLMSATWRLREGLRWSDGSPLTAADVVFTWRYCVSPGADCAQSKRFEGVQSVTALDDRAVSIAFDSPTPYPYTAFVSAWTPIISRAQFEEDCPAASHACPHNFAPVGTGPYRIVEFDDGGNAVYERNPRYRGAAPYFDRVTIVGGGSAEDAARAALAEGTADYAWNLQIPPEELAEMRTGGESETSAAFASRVEVIVVNQTNPDPALGESRSEYLDGENPHPFLTFKPIPQAMSLAIDRARLSESLYGFAGRPACNVIDAPANYASSANDGCLTQDIAAANRLLDESGVADSDGDGTREYAGAPLRVSFQTTANAVRQETQRLIAEWWGEIGIETEIISHDAGVFFGGDPAEAEGASYLRFFADVQMYADGSGVDPQQWLANGLCGQMQTRANRWSGGNNARACDPEYDALYAELARTPLGAERERLAKRLNDMFTLGYRQIPLINRGIVSAHAADLLNVRANGWDSSLWNIAEWRRAAP